MSIKKKIKHVRHKALSVSSTTDSDLLCHNCGCVGHAQAQCAFNKVTIILEDVSATSIVEFVENKNFWKRGNYMRYDPEEGIHKIKIFLSPGYHEFKFLVDSKEWVLSKLYPVIKNDQGIENNYNIVEPVGYPAIWFKNVNSVNKTVSLVICLPKYSYKSMLKNLNLLVVDNIEVEIIGSWDNWSNTEKLEYTEKAGKFIDVFTITKELPINYYQYKFKINGELILDPFRQVVNSSPAPNHPLNIYQLIQQNRKYLLKPQIDIKQVLNIYEYHVESLDIFTLYGHSMNLVNSNLWIFGGYHHNSFLGYMIKIDPETLNVSFITSDNEPTGLGFHKSLTYGNKIIIFGGQTDETVEYDYFTFNTESNEWTNYKIKNMPQKREMFNLTHKKDTPLVYIFGGYYCSTDLRIEETFNDLHVLHLDHMTFEKLDCHNLPQPRCHHSLNIIDTCLYLFGGMQVISNNKICCNDFYKIDVNDHNNLHWVKLDITGNIPTSRYGHIALTFGAQLIINGGIFCNPNSCTYDYLWDLYVIDTKTLISYQVNLDGNPGKLGRAFHTGSIYGNTIIIFGGKFKSSRDNNGSRLLYIPLKIVSKSSLYSKKIEAILQY